MASGLERYAAERFLCRLGRSAHRERLVLKGAALFAIRGIAYRPTRDLDFTGYGSAEALDVIGMLREVCQVPDDVAELVFDPESITAAPIRDDSEYHGLRVKVDVRLGASRIQLLVDIGFGNAIVPGPEEVVCRTLLGDDAPRVLAYPIEAVVAEKLHAVVILGERNSRYKDFYDVHVLAAALPFDLDTVVRAVTATFERRATAKPGELPVALTSRFYSAETRAGQWRAYVTRNNLLGTPEGFELVGERILMFLVPVWEAFESEPKRSGSWPPAGPWRLV